MNHEKCSNINQYNEECNTLLLDVEEKNRILLEENPNKFSYLYPNLNDPNFNIKIAQKKEFANKYDGSIPILKNMLTLLSKAI